ncbi:heparinase II/III family protein [Sphingomicrobium sediminis]|uniref:Heparinase II/III family protein n=1 Tax=Sphingomicrobium sediminis TaxID=2950949 RepID=A0A9X2EJN4_9SPHN|nr:heparinase II/III family protein [Sphingomicrobium sediminis]MCM8558031.1 heparinase II/III family protein [Sphingomicrobium sediminis]
MSEGGEPRLKRWFGGKREPLRLTAIPRDHVVGDMLVGERLLGGRFLHGARQVALNQVDFNAAPGGDPLLERLHSFAWLRDLAAVAGREQAAPLGEAITGHWLAGDERRGQDVWNPVGWGERILYWTAYAPFILSSSDAAYRARLVNRLAAAARFLDKQADKAKPGLDRITAWAGLTVASLTLSGGVARVARAESGLLRALAQGQHEDGGLKSRAPYEQVELVDRLGLVRAAYFAARQSLPDPLEDGATSALSALHGVLMPDGGLASWQGGNPGNPARIAAIIEGCGMRARPLREARGWGYQRLSALGTIAQVDAARPPANPFSDTSFASTLAFELADGAQRLVMSCGGGAGSAGELDPGLANALRASAAHSTLILDNMNSTAMLDDGQPGKGVETVEFERGEDDGATRLTAGHDGYHRRAGLGHERRIALGNDGKEIRGEDRLVPVGRRLKRKTLPFDIRFHLAPDIEVTQTADGLGALLRSSAAPPWQFRTRGARLRVEPSLVVDAHGAPRETQQLVISDECGKEGAAVTWHFRRSS